MSLILKDKSRIPGHDWVAYVPETNATFRSPSRIGLIPIVAAHLRANGLPPMLDPERDIDSFICAAIPEQQRPKMCVYESAETPPASVRLGVNDVLGFVDFVMKNGIHFVEQSEAEHRAAICAACPWNVPLASHCPTCMGARTLIEKSTDALAGRQTPHDKDLRNCGVCGCFLKLKVHLKNAPEYRPGRPFPEWCWVTKN